MRNRRISFHKVRIDLIFIQKPAETFMGDSLISYSTKLLKCNVRFEILSLSQRLSFELDKPLKSTNFKDEICNNTKDAFFFKLKHG